MSPDLTVTSQRMNLTPLISVISLLSPRTRMRKVISAEKAVLRSATTTVMAPDKTTIRGEDLSSRKGDTTMTTTLSRKREDLIILADNITGMNADHLKVKTEMVLESSM